MTPKKRILSSGLCLLSAKKKTDDLATLSLTDFNRTEKVMFDIKAQKLINVDPGMKLLAADILVIQEYLKGYEKNPVTIAE